MNVALNSLRRIQRSFSARKTTKVCLHSHHPQQLLQIQFTGFTNRTYCSAAVMNVKYEDVKASTLCKDKLIIDVREPNELAETGVIPGSVNIPLGSVESILKNMPESDFIQKYGREKPSAQSSVIFSCRSGKRSLQALEIAKQLGYNNLFNYTGGWLDWEEKELKH